MLSLHNMANMCKTLLLALAFVITLIHSISCKPLKRSSPECYGTDCLIDKDLLDLHDIPYNTELLENDATSVMLLEITAHLKNIANIHQNTTATHLPSISQTLEDDKNLQELQNVLIENVTAVITPMLSEVILLMQYQQAMQDRHNQMIGQLMQDQADRQSKLLENATDSLQRIAYTMEDQGERLEDLPIESGSTHPPTTTERSPINSEMVHTCSSVHTSGQYTLSPQNGELCPFPIVCDMDTDSGGWIVFQRRFDGSVGFDRVWDEYERGFGSLVGEFWLGLQKIHMITSRGRWELRVDLEDFDGNKVYAKYDNFRIGDSASSYRLSIGSYSGTAGDSMRYCNDNLNGMPFTTKDQDHDQSNLNCAVFRRGGWWHKNCSKASLNGLYMGKTGYSVTGVTWYKWKNSFRTMKKTELKIRPML